MIVERKCEICWKEFEAKSPKAKYCSQRCRGRASYAKTISKKKQMQKGNNFGSSGHWEY